MVALINMEVVKLKPIPVMVENIKNGGLKMLVMDSHIFKVKGLVMCLIQMIVVRFIHIQ